MCWTSRFVPRKEAWMWGGAVVAMTSRCNSWFTGWRRSHYGLLFLHIISLIAPSSRLQLKTQVQLYKTKLNSYGSSKTCDPVSCRLQHDLAPHDCRARVRQNRAQRTNVQVMVQINISTKKPYHFSCEHISFHVSSEAKSICGIFNLRWLVCRKFGACMQYITTLRALRVSCPSLVAGYLC